jgi:hypothetical protein
LAGAPVLTRAWTVNAPQSADGEIVLTVSLSTAEIPEANAFAYTVEGN